MAINLLDMWPETISLVLLAIGFVASLLAGSLVMSYIIVAICGMMFGRIWYRNRKNFRFTWFLIMFGFAAGYMLGNTVINNYASNIYIAIFFLFGIMFSYHMHAKNYIRTAEY
jgi:hypothetical protein